MNRGEFLERLFTMYSDSFTEKNKHGWNAAYQAVLSDPTIDYEKLFKIVLEDWKYKDAPRTSWISDKAKSCIPPKETKASKNDWRNRYIITRWSQDSIWISFTQGPGKNGEYLCGKEGEFAKTCTECLKAGKNGCFECCHDCVSKCTGVMPCLMQRLVEEHNNREAERLEQQL